MGIGCWPEQSMSAYLDTSRDTPIWAVAVPYPKSQLVAGRVGQVMLILLCGPTAPECYLLILCREARAQALLLALVPLAGWQEGCELQAGIQDVCSRQGTKASPLCSTQCPKTSVS